MTIKTDVCIVGGGPTGLTASILLSKLGINHTLIEKRTTSQSAPAAHVINRRTLEIFRQCGLPMDEIYQLDRHGQDALMIRWGLGLAGATLGQLTINASDTQNKVSREHLVNISQPLLEAALRKAAMQSSHCTMMAAHRWLGFLDKPADNQVVRSELLTAAGEKIEIQSDYLLAADGAASPIRQHLNIDNVGPDHIVTFLSLSCEIDQTKIKRHTGTLIDWCLDPVLAGVVICHDPKALSVYMRVLHEPFESIEDYDDARCRTLLSELFGKDVPFKILHKGTWKMTAQVAAQFQVGRVFLVGDSAHRFPPTGGLGLNSGVADVHNLIWKIAAMHQQNTSLELLASYEQERKVVVQNNCDASLLNFHKMDAVVEAIGLDPSKAALLAQVLNFSWVQRLPKKMQSALQDLLLFPVRKILARSGANTAKGAKLRSHIQQTIDDQRAHFDMPGLELGYVYRNGCAISKSAAQTPENTVLKYTPIALPGARFPHIELCTDDIQSSSLDLIAYDRYTLLTNGPLAQILAAETFGLDLHIQDVGILMVASAKRSLATQLNIPAGGWILIRPDGHIADVSTGLKTH